MKNKPLRAGDIKLWQRILLVGLTGTLPLFIVSLILIKTSYSDSIHFGKQERLGITFVRPLERLLYLVPRYQAAARQAVAGDRTANPELTRLQQQINQELDRLADHYQGKLGKVLKFTDAELAAQHREIARLSVLQSNWAGLQQTASTGPAGDAFARNMVDSIQAMIAHAGDLSNLALDNELDSFYLVDITISTLPQTQARLAGAVLQSGERTVGGQTQLTAARAGVVSELLRQDDLDRILKDAQTALGEDKNHYGVSPSLQKNLPPVVEQFKAANEAFIGLLNRVAAGEMVPPADLAAAGWNAHTACFLLWQTSANELDRLLTIRIQAIKSERLHCYLIIIGTLMLVAIIMGIIIRYLLAAHDAEFMAVAEEIRNREAQLRAIGDNLPAGMVYRILRDFDGTMRYLHISAGLKRLTGLAVEDVLQNASLLQERILPEDRPKLLTARQNSLTNKSVFQVIVRVRRTDEDIRWIQLYSSPERLPDGRFVWDGIGLDVTEQRRAVEALTLLRSLIDRTNDAIEILDPETGRFLDVNEQASRLHGYSQEEYKSLSITDVDPWFGEGGPLAWSAQVAKLKHSGFLIFEGQHRRKDGSTFPVEINATFIQLERDYVLAVVRDITERKRAETTLKQSEERFSRIFRHSPIPISLHQFPGGKFVDANEGFLRLGGYTREEVIGRTPLELQIYPDPGKRSLIIEQLAKHGHLHAFDQLFRTKSGQIRHTILWIELIEIGGEKFHLAMSTDITEQKQAEQRQKQSEERFLHIFNTSPLPISLTRFSDGTLLNVNESFLRMSGFTREEVIGHTVVELGIYADHDARPFMREQLQKNGHLHGYEQRFRTKSGEIRDRKLWLELITVGGEPCALTFALDVTEQKQTEVQRKQSEERFARIFNNNPLPIALSQFADGKIVDINESWMRMSGYAREEVIGRTAIELGIYPDPKARTSIMTYLEKFGHLHGFEKEFRTKSGQIRNHVTWMDLITIGGRKNILILTLDVTEQKQAERQQKLLEDQLRQTQKLEALGTLAGGIAHDFNNILGAIISFTELCKLDNPDNTELQDNLGEVLKASNRATNLVRQILSFSRQQKHERKNLQLAPVIKEALKLLRATLPATIEIQQAIDGELPDVKANPTQIHQVIMNLCTNAAHAMKGKQGQLCLRLESLDLEKAGSQPHIDLVPGQYVRLMVSDTGHGMDEATLKRIFEPFFTTKGPGEGTGLGLSVVHGIIREHEGAIAVESQPGKGTTFSIYFPAQAAAGTPENLQGDSIPRGNGERVLFVDDEKALSEVAQKMIQRLGYQPVVFDSSKAAWEAFQKEPMAFDVLISDLTMPVLTGLDLARLALGVRPNLPVILTSGSSGTFSTTEVQEIGVRELVGKPLDYQTLATALNKVLRNRPQVK